MGSLIHFWRKLPIEEGMAEKKYERRNSAEGVDLGDSGIEFQCSFFLEYLPREIHFVILSFLNDSDLFRVSLINKDFRDFVQDDQLWKTMYIKKWLSKADNKFIQKYFPADFKWKETFRNRLQVEKKYLKEKDNKKCSPTEDEWMIYLRKGKLLAKFTTEDFNEFILLATVEQEEYKSAACQTSCIKEKNESADIYYYWGRCIKDLSRNKTRIEKYRLLLDEQEKYEIASKLEPKDSYILYSWAINLRFQLENLEGEEAVQIYRKSSKKYRESLCLGYIEKYVLWGLGSLKLHMAKKQICTNNFEKAKYYLDKAEKKYSELRRRWEEGDLLTAFSLSFNYSCIYSCRYKISKFYEEDSDFKKKSIERLRECSSNPQWAEYLTLDLLDLWYFDEFRTERWFKSIYSTSKPKKLSATW